VHGAGPLPETHELSPAHMEHGRRAAECKDETHPLMATSGRGNAALSSMLCHGNAYQHRD